jgi:tRNA dimethylallyltransferase
MQKKLLIVCGPTATGKTKLAIALAHKFNGELVSSDSRQVYKGMDIGTGKDILKNSKIKHLQEVGCGYYEIGSVKVWGYDLVEPTADFSVAEYFEIIKDVISNIWEREKLPVIVGGTGLYIKSIIDGIETSTVPRNLELREELERKEVCDLFNILTEVDSKKAKSLNGSDRNNPRRLIRAIEVAKYLEKNPNLKMLDKLKFDSLLMVGLDTDKGILDKKIKERVDKRLMNGFEKEVMRLLKKGIDWKYQSMQGIGYRQYEKYRKGVVSKSEFINEWFLEECRYSKRQTTWFKKDKRIVWFDISKPNFIGNVENIVQSWYYDK